MMALDWIDYEVCDGLAVMDSENTEAWLRCEYPMDVRR